MFGLQRLLYGPLRVIEVEQLYEKAWFAVTETCLAMTIFREEVGGWFFVMFISLLIGKVWGWIGEGRVEVLEQQPPANPRLFHIRLSISLTLSILFNLHMLNYSVSTVREQAEPNMMVMFAFEFAVLVVASLSTATRYSISLHEAAVIKDQMRLQLLERRTQRQHQRGSAQDTAVPGSNTRHADFTSPQSERDLEEDDVDVPGWEEKGRWVFYLDLATGKYGSSSIRQKSAEIILLDFFKLILYLSFFCVLCIFYGMPIFIIRDVAITIRSFYKRIHDFVRYRHATRDMNERYPDAVAEEIAREDVCIICRETMRPWTTVPRALEANTEGIPLREDVQAVVDARLRPKKLPCGHVLHFACLRSWLERQQNCPTCRRPVIASSSAAGQTPLARAHNQQGGDHPVVNMANAGRVPPGETQQENPGPNRIRVFNFGPFRLGFGAGQDLPGLAQQINRVQPLPNQRHYYGNENQNGNRQHSNHSFVSRGNPNTIHAQLQVIEQQLMQHINELRAQADQLYMVRALQGELARLRIMQAAQANPNVGETFPNHLQAVTANNPISVSNASTVHTYGPTQEAVGRITGFQELPSGLTVPEGWTVLPLQRFSHETAPPMASMIASQSALSQRADQLALPQTQVPASQPGLDITQVPNQNGSIQTTRQPNFALYQTLPNTTSAQLPLPQPQDLGERHSNQVLVEGDPGRKIVNHNQGEAESAGTPPTIDSVPRWKSVSSGKIRESIEPDDTISSPPTTSRSVHPTIQQNASMNERTDNKGKGRAVTVEDAIDDLE